MQPGNGQLVTVSEIKGPETQALCSVNSCGRLVSGDWPETGLPEACGSPAGRLCSIGGIWFPCPLTADGALSWVICTLVVRGQTSGLCANLLSSFSMLGWAYALAK